MQILRRWFRRELSHPILTWTGTVLFCAFLALVMARTLLVQGNTHWNEEGLQLALQGNAVAEPVLNGLSLALLALELLADWPRALVAGGLILLRQSGLVNIYQMIPLEMAIVVSLCNLSRESVIRWTWLILHLLYIALLLWLLNGGWVSEVLTDPGSSKIDFFARQGTSLGMNHPNTLAQLLMTTLPMIWVIWHPKRRWLSCLLFWPAAYGIFYLTLSRTAALVMIAFPILSMLSGLLWGDWRPWVWKKKQAALPAPALRNGKVKVALAALLPLLAIAGSIGVSWFYAQNNRVLGGDTAFSLRFQEFRYFLEGGIPAFGQIPTGRVYLDNFYMWMLYCCGWVSTALWMGLYAWMTGFLAWKKRDALLAVALVFLFYAYMENALVFVAHFFVPLLGFCVDRRRINDLPSSGKAAPAPAEPA